MASFTVEQQSKREFLSLRVKITAVCCAIITVIVALMFVVISISEYNMKMDFIEEQLSSSIERTLKYRTLDELVENAQTVDSRVEIGTGSSFNPETYIPIILYKADYQNNILVPVDISSAQLTDESMMTGTKRFLESKPGFFRVDETSLVCMKEHTDEGDVIAFTDSTNVDLYMQNLVQMLMSVFAFIIIFAFACFWSLSNWIVSPVKDMWKRQQHFIADASHELKTPVSVIMANADIIASTTADDDVKKRSECIFDESEKMKELIGDMMYLLTDKALTAKKEDVDLSRTIMKLAMAFEAKAWERHLSIEYDDIAPNVHIQIDPVGVERVISILMDNACKYADENSVVEIGLVQGKKTCTLHVSNIGPVIPYEDLEAIFDRFFRTDSARTRTSEASYGLGLAMAKDIVVANGGEIRAESSKDKTTFTVVLPTE